MKGGCFMKNIIKFSVLAAICFAVLIIGAPALVIFFGIWGQLCTVFIAICFLSLLGLVVFYSINRIQTKFPNLHKKLKAISLSAAALVVVIAFVYGCFMLSTHFAKSFNTPKASIDTTTTTPSPAVVTLTPKPVVEPTPKPVVEPTPKPVVEPTTAPIVTKPPQAFDASKIIGADGQFWKLDESSKTLTWIGLEDGSVDVHQGSVELLALIQKGYIFKFQTSVPGTIIISNGAINGFNYTDPSTSKSIAVSAGSFIITSPGNVGGFRWTPQQGYGWRK